MKALQATKDPVVHLTLDDALELLSAAKAKGIPHVVSLLRDPKNPSRILAMSVAESEPVAH